jgi:Kef-type K+ transport system membrane component KefB
MLVGTVEVTLLVLLIVVLAGPIVAERFRIPGMLGLIFFGMVFGPHVLGWLGRVSLVEDLGAIGILYLMFLAGISFNIKAFMENKKSSIIIGLLGFAIPFFLSVYVSRSLLSMEILGAALVGAMWASNTLVAYPDVRSAGLSDNRAVRDAVSSGVVADLISLFILAVATSYAVIEAAPDLFDSPDVATEQAPTLPLLIAIPLLAGFTLWALPLIGRWFFVKVGHSRVQRFLFVLVGMTAGASIAVLGGIAGLIGAFLAGLGLNSLIPKSSDLMDRLDFVGSTVFVPAFLVSIGLTIAPAALFDVETLILGLIFTLLVIVGKSLAATISSFAFGFSFAEGGLMAALSYGQAASTLAIAQVGLEFELFGQETVNGAVLAVVLTALATSYGTRFFIGRVERPAPPPSSIGEVVLVDVRPSSSNLEVVMKFAGRIAHADGGVLTPFAVPKHGELERAREHIAQAEEAAAKAGHDTDGIARLSTSFADGALALTEEVGATLAVLAWTGLRFQSDHLFGSEIDQFGESAPIPVIAAYLTRPWSRVVLMIGNTRVPWHNEDAQLAANIAGRLRGKDEPLLLLGSDVESVKDLLGSEEGLEVVVGHRAELLLSRILEDDLILAPAYVLQETSIAEQLRLARKLVGLDVAVVAGANRLSIARSDSPLRTGAILNPQG